MDPADLSAAECSHPARDLLRLLVWLVRHCVTQRGGLHAGTIMTTGSWTGMPWVEPPAAVIGEICPLPPMGTRLL